MLVLGDPVLHVLPAKRDDRESGELKAKESQKGRTEEEGISLSGEVMSRCEALAGREDISRVQGRADKECHIITSPYGLRLFDPICLLVTQAKWEICSFCIYSCSQGQRTCPRKLNS